MEALQSPPQKRPLSEIRTTPWGPHVVITKAREGGVHLHLLPPIIRMTTLRITHLALGESLEEVVHLSGRLYSQPR